MYRTFFDRRRGQNEALRTCEPMMSPQIWYNTEKVVKSSPGSLGPHVQDHHTFRTISLTFSPRLIHNGRANIKLATKTHCAFFSSRAANRQCVQKNKPFKSRVWKDNKIIKIRRHGATDNCGLLGEREKIKTVTECQIWARIPFTCGYFRDYIQRRLKLLRIAHTGHFQMRSNTYKIYAGERLTEAEIMTCC